MRRLGLALAFAFGAIVAASPAWAAVAVVQHGTQFQTASPTTSPFTCTPTIPGAVTTTNLAVIFISVGVGDGTVAAPTTPGGWTVGPTTDAHSANGEVRTTIFYRTGFTGTSQAITATGTINSGTFGCSAVMFELSGANNSTPTAVGNTATGAFGSTGGQTQTGANGAPPVSGSMALALWNYGDPSTDTSANTVQTGWTALSNAGDGATYNSSYIADIASPTSGTLLTSTLQFSNVTYTGMMWNSTMWVMYPVGSGPPVPPTYLLTPSAGVFPGGQP